MDTTTVREPETEPALRQPTPYQQRLLLAVAAGVVLLILLACGFADSAGNLARYNAYWNCPTVSPVPTTCVMVTGTPDPLGTPGPPEPQCSEPLATATPYGRQILTQGHQTSLNIFHHHQDVRWATFRLTYRNFRATRGQIMFWQS